MVFIDLDPTMIDISKYQNWNSHSNSGSEKWTPSIVVWFRWIVHVQISLVIRCQKCWLMFWWDGLWGSLNREVGRWGWWSGSHWRLFACRSRWRWLEHWSCWSVCLRGGGLDGRGRWYCRSWHACRVPGSMCRGTYLKVLSVNSGTHTRTMPSIAL